MYGFFFLGGRGGKEIKNHTNTTKLDNQKPRKKKTIKVCFYLSTDKFYFFREMVKMSGQEVDSARAHNKFGPTTDYKMAT